MSSQIFCSVLVPFIVFLISYGLSKPHVLLHSACSLNIKSTILFSHHSVFFVDSSGWSRHCIAQELCKYYNHNLNRVHHFWWQLMFISFILGTRSVHEEHQGSGWRYPNYHQESQWANWHQGIGHWSCPSSSMGSRSWQTNPSEWTAFAGNWNHEVLLLFSYFYFKNNYKL